MNVAGRLGSRTAGVGDPTVGDAERIYHGWKRCLNGVSVGSPWTLPRSPGAVRSRKRGRALSCGKVSGVSTYSLITGPCEVRRRMMSLILCGLWGEGASGESGWGRKGWSPERQIKGDLEFRRLARGRGGLSQLHCRPRGTGGADAEAGGGGREEWCLSTLGAALQSGARGVEIASFGGLSLGLN